MAVKASVLIVDDEMLARLGIRSMLDQMPDYCVVGEAASASEALALATQLRPRIVLTDIVMPGMDGLDMIRLLSERVPQTRFIILSCVENIPTLQEAILLGVSGYLIKNALTERDLKKLLDKARAESERLWDGDDPPGALHTEARIAHLLQNLMYAQNGTEQAVRALAALGVDVGVPPLYVMVADLPADATEKMAYCRVANELINAMSSGVAFLDADGRLCIVLADSAPTSTALCQHLASKLHDTFMQYFDADICFGISELLMSHEDVPNGYLQALKLKNNRYYGGNRVAFFHIDSQMAKQTWQEIHDRTEAILTACTSRDRSGCTQEVEALAQLLRESTLLSPEEVQLLLLPIFHAIMAALGIGDRFLAEKKTTLASYVCGFEEFEALIEALFELLEEDELLVGHLDDAMDRVAFYIQERFREKITLDMVARHVHMSPHYVCRCFKRARGTTIMDYAMQCRITEAQAMLRGGATVSETSNALGFCSEGHFIRAFKKAQGITPGRFARQRAQS